MGAASDHDGRRDERLAPNGLADFVSPDASSVDADD